MGAATLCLVMGACQNTTTAGPNDTDSSREEGEASEVRREGEIRLASDVKRAPRGEMRPGQHVLGRDGRDGLLYVPAGLRPGERAPLAVMLHGAGGTVEGGIRPFLRMADRWKVILVAPKSQGRTWDVILGGYGPDVVIVERAIDRALERLSVNRRRIALVGFSDGASYALSLGLTNGELFSSIIAFSPGFAVPARLEGEPGVFVSHGIDDGVLPIGSTSRQLVPRLRDAGVRVHYEEFDGGHAVPPRVARAALEWWLGSPREQEPPKQG